MRSGGEIDDILSHFIYEFKVLQANVGRHLGLCLAFLVDDHFCCLAVVGGSRMLSELDIQR